MAESTPQPITDVEFDDLRKVVFTNVRYAMDAFFAYLVVHERADKDPEVLAALNRQVRHWNVTLYSLQMGFFIAIGRLLDTDGDGRTLHKLFNDAVANPHLFSRAALAARKAPHIGEEGAIAYAADKWEPTAPELRDAFKKPFKTHQKWFVEVLRPIRHQVFAHPIADEALTDELFAGAQIADVEALLFSIYEAVDHLWQLHLNGRPREVCNSRLAFERDRERAREGMNVILDALVRL